MSFTIASCWLIFTFIEDIENDLSGLNTNKIRKLNCQTLKKRFCKIIQQFCMIEQLSARKTNLNNVLIDIPFYFNFSCRFINHFNNIYEFLILGYFVWSLSTICCTLFLLVALLVWSVLTFAFRVHIFSIYSMASCSHNQTPIQSRF